MEGNEMRDFAAMQAMAKRQLDGMVVNRDLMAKDVIDLIALNTKYQEQLRRLSVEVERLTAGVAASAARADGFDSAFNELFKDIGRKSAS
jgi:hypothetical protein